MALNTGDKLGPYEIVALIGKGGMGEVYRARDPRLNRDVAIKVSARQFSDRFAREAQAIAKLNHPNICTLYDVGPNYLVMEFVDGANPKGPLPEATVLDYARQMAAALDEAHENGVTHRDLKPGNIIVRPDGVLKILDFGLAKIQEASIDPAEAETVPAGMTAVGQIIGTPAYMSPEQARGKNIDKRTDLWAMGVILYELSTGERLFSGDTMADVIAPATGVDMLAAMGCTMTASLLSGITACLAETSAGITVTLPRFMSLSSRMTTTTGSTNRYDSRDRKSTRLNSSHIPLSRMPSSA